MARERKSDQGSFHVYESRYNVKIQILVSPIIALAAARSARPVPMPMITTEITKLPTFTF